jgi:radial spoke head protein 4A
MSSVQDKQATNLKAYFMQADAEGRSVYDHLQAVFLDILDENTLDVANRPERFAEFSALMKQQQFAYGDAAPTTAARPATEPAVSSHASKAKALFSRPEPEVMTTVERPTPYTTITTTTVVPKSAPKVPSIANEANVWRHAGVGLPAREAFHLEQSITKLAMQKSLEDVRFFGKIFGTQGNYLVVTSKRHLDENETIFEEANTMPKPPRKKTEVDIQAEPGFKGCNRLTFWVAPDAVSPWTKLSDTTPQLINAARHVKKLFTGNLDAPVTAYPAFDGTERDYLRAQLSRILAATYVAPQNALEAVTVEEEEEEEEEEGKPKKAKPAKYVPLTAPNKEYAPDEDAGVAALADLDQWVHAEAYIYETGRQTKVPPKPEVEGEEEEPEPEEEENEEEVKEEEEKELFGPLKKDGLFAVINVPKEPNPEEDGEEDEAAADDGAEDGEEGKDPNDPDKMEEDEEIPDDEPSKKKLYPWTARLTNTLFKKHSVCVLRSVRWPGAVAYASQQGKKWGAVYLGDGQKAMDYAFTPLPAGAVQKEAPDMLEVADATAANEKLVLRGEEPKEADSEDEKEDEEEEEPQDE